MPGLRDLQRAFAAAVLAGDDSEIADLLVSDAFAGTRRLHVYRNNVHASLAGALGAVYPVVERLVGPGFFGQAARAYLGEHPSRSGNLHDFGDAFATFLAAYPPARELVYLPDVARLEWARHEVYHAAEPPAFPVAGLATVPAHEHAALCFRLSPAARLIASPHPVARIWEVNQPDAEAAGPVHLDGAGDTVLVIRHELEVGVYRLAPTEFSLLAALANGERLGAACGIAAGATGDFDAGEALCRHVMLGTLVDFTRHPPEGRALTT